VDPVVLLA